MTTATLGCPECMGKCGYYGKLDTDEARMGCSSCNPLADAENPELKFQEMSARKVLADRSRRYDLARFKMGTKARLGQTVEGAARDAILATIDGLEPKKNAINAFMAAHQFDLIQVLGAKVTEWNNFMGFVQSKDAEVFNLYQTLSQDKAEGVVSLWTSEMEGAVSGWQYGINGLYGIVQSLGAVPVPAPVPTPGQPPVPTKPAGTPSWVVPAVAVAGGVLGLGVLYAVFVK